MPYNRLNPFKVYHGRGYKGWPWALPSCSPSVIHLHCLWSHHVSAWICLYCCKIFWCYLSNGPMTGPQISLFLCSKWWPRTLPLNSCSWSVLECAHRVLKISCWPTNSKVIPAQIFFLSFFKRGLDFHGVSLMVESQVIGGHIMLLDLIMASSTSITDIKVTRLDRVNEVFVRLLNCFMWIWVWIDYRVCRRKTIF